MNIQRKKIKDKKTKQDPIENKKKEYRDQIKKLDNSLNFKNNVLKDAAMGALQHTNVGVAFNLASGMHFASKLDKKLKKAHNEYRNDLLKWQQSGHKGPMPEFKKPVMSPIKSINPLHIGTYGAAREIGAHAINKIKPDMPYEAKYGISSAISSPLLAPKAMLSTIVSLPKKLAFAVIAGLIGAGTSYLNKKDIEMTKKYLNKKMKKLNKKSAKDEGIISFINKTANVTISKASKNNKISKLILKNPRAVGALIGLAILAGIGKFAYSKHKRNKAQDADVTGNNLIPLGKKVTEIIITYKPQAESGFLKSIKSLIMKYPKTTALIAGTTIATAGMSLRNNKKEKGK